ncbi:MAG: hypothetical protein E3J72_04645 [Planctomycetota bacterium]|nr:MAG: hypothetical protein E3J72_04645 [Planctomycetota bacterium]
MGFSGDRLNFPPLSQVDSRETSPYWRVDSSYFSVLNTLFANHYSELSAVSLSIPAEFPFAEIFPCSPTLPGLRWSNHPAFGQKKSAVWVKFF